AVARVGQDAAPVESPRGTMRERRLATQDEIVCQGVVEHESAALAVLRDVREAERGAPPHVERRDVAIAQSDAPRRDSAQPRDGFHELGLSVAFHARDTKDLAGGNGERDVGDAAFAARALYRQ